MTHLLAPDGGAPGGFADDVAADTTLALRVRPRDHHDVAMTS